MGKFLTNSLGNFVKTLLLGMQTIIQSFLFIIADESGVVYNPSTKIINFREEQEKIRARFLVEQVEKGKFRTEDARLDVEIPNCDIFDSIDLVFYKDNQPLLAVDFLPQGTCRQQAKKNILAKSRAIGANQAALFLGRQKLVFVLKKG